MSHDKRSAMEAEMNRFEAEIGVPVPPYYSGRHVIGSNTYLKVQQQLEQHNKMSIPPGIPFLPPMLPTVSSPDTMASLSGIPPPPPPPPSLLIPHQVHRPMMLVRPPPMNELRHERPRPPVVPAIVSATPKLYTPNKPVLPTMGPSQITPGPSSSKKRRKAAAAAAKAKEAEKVILPPTNVGPSFSLEELGPKRSKERKIERAERGGKKTIRTAGGQVWEDCSLQDWPEDDFRIFCGDLGNDVTDEVLTRAFNKFPSFQKAKVVRDKRTNKTKGFGFISFKDPQDFINAMKEMNGRYVGSRPIKLRKSMWRNRNADVVRKKDRERTQLIGLLTGR